MKYRKKPVVIDAVTVASARHNAAHDWMDLPEWVRDAYDNGGIVFHSGGVSVITLEGAMEGGLTDWIIRGVQGEIYPCKADIFAATYERAE